MYLSIVFWIWFRRSKSFICHYFPGGMHLLLNFCVRVHSVWICAYVWMCECTCMYMCVYVCMCMYVCMYICMYVYICMYMCRCMCPRNPEDVRPIGSRVIGSFELPDCGESWAVITFKSSTHPLDCQTSLQFLFGYFLSHQSFDCLVWFPFCVCVSGFWLKSSIQEATDGPTA